MCGGLAAIDVGVEIDWQGSMSRAGKGAYCSFLTVSAAGSTAWLTIVDEVWDRYSAVFAPLFFRGQCATLVLC